MFYAGNYGTAFALEMVGNVVIRQLLGYKIAQCGILGLFPGFEGVGTFGPCSLLRIYLFAIQALVCLKIAFEAFYVFVRKVWQAAYVHIVGEVVQFHSRSQRVLYTRNEFVVWFTLLFVM